MQSPIPQWSDDAELVDLRTILFSLFLLNHTTKDDEVRLNILCQCCYLAGHNNGVTATIKKLEIDTVA